MRIDIYDRASDKSHKFDVKVTADGMFRTVIPDEMVEFLTTADPMAVGKNKNSDPIAFKPTLAGLKSMLHSYFRWMQEATTTKELFIFYRFDQKCAYVKHKNGEIYENGNVAPGEFGKDSNWAESKIDAVHSVGTFSFGVGAQVRVKVTKVDRAGNKTEKWESPIYHKELIDPEIEKLNSFTGIAVKDGSIFNNEGECHVVPYDPDLAKFLHEAMLTICKLSDRMSEFFSDTETTLIAAKQGANLLSGPKEKT